MWNLPYQTHRYFMEPLGGQHARKTVYLRYINFIQSIYKSKRSGPINLLETTINDTRTITGKNVRKILLETGTFDILSIDTNELKRSFQYKQIPDEEKWRINILKELVNTKQGNLEIIFDEETEKLTAEEIDNMIHIITTS